MKAVIFDFYGTLAQIAPDVPSFNSILSQAGFTWSEAAPARWGDATLPLEHHAWSQSRADYEAAIQERRRRLFAECGVNDPDVMQTLLDEADAWRRNYRMQCYSDVVGTLDALAERNLILGLCSNWDWELERFLHQVALTAYFNAICWSARVGVRKPHAAIYRTVLSALDIGPQEAVFVGDTWDADVEGPSRACMAGVHIDRSSDKSLERLQPGVYRINSLLHLLPLLDELSRPAPLHPTS